MAKPTTTFVCNNCGYTSYEYLGRCPNCGKWNTLQKKVKYDTTPTRTTRTHLASSVNFTGLTSKPHTLNHIKTQNEPRYKTDLSEFNRVLGGGIVKGSLVLLGGSPGIGKSTLLLQVSNQLSQKGLKILYVTGEESLNQVKLRANRFKIKGNENLYLYAETDMNSVKNAIQQLKPDIVIIDSVQTMQEPNIDSVPGSVTQVKNVTNDLMHLAKTNGISIFLVGHITKSGIIAGPKTLEHMVDTVLLFEGDNHHNYRILRAEKNRFGSTNEMGLFEMYTTGLKEITNPSKLFLSERLKNATGSAIVPSMEGSRPILIEIQALVTQSIFGYAQRTTEGISRNRISLLMAVLEKRAGLMLQNQDAYLKITGGLDVNEPAIDLAIAISIASSYKNISTDPKECYVGEIGLTGEIRRVNNIKQRVEEASKLGFNRILVPRFNIGGWKFPKDIKVIGVTTINQALHIALDYKRKK